MKEIEEKIKQIHDICPAIDGKVEKNKSFMCPRCRIELKLVDDSYPCEKCGADWAVVTLSLSLGGENESEESI